MKVFLLILLMMPLGLLAQPAPNAAEDITGTWTGYVSTDQKKLHYEVVLSDSSGILTGFSKIIFNVKGEQYSAVKSLIVKREKNKYILEEDKLLYDNLQDDGPKKIRQINTVWLEVTEKQLLLTGSFKTITGKDMRKASGEISLHKDITPDSSALLAELDQMKLAKDLSFRKPKPKPEPPKEIIPEEPEWTLTRKPVNNGKLYTNTKLLARASAPIKPLYRKIAMKPIPVMARAAAPVVKPPVAAVTRTEPSKPVATTSAPVVSKPAVVRPSGPVFDMGGRSVETIQTVYFKNDSIKLTLYDNGEVDGDTVSVVLNGKMIMSKKGLSTNAITQTVYLLPEMGDSLQMIMYAENLGTIAPNTGLLIVQDGRDRYEIRFSGDLNKNAAIIFKRRKG